MGKTDKRWNQDEITIKCASIKNDRMEIQPTLLIGKAIRTIRKVLVVILRAQKLSDDVPNTVLVHAKEIPNKRPITKLSDDPIDPRVLSPCDLLHFSHGEGTYGFEVFSAET